MPSMKKTKPPRSPLRPRRPGATFRRPTDDDVRRRAYQLFLQRGAEHGRDWEDWLAAERELRLER
jgi:hypothetical protein